MRRTVIAGLAVVCALSGCTAESGGTTVTESIAITSLCVAAEFAVRCDLAAYPDRPYLAVMPPGADPELPLPVVVALHGGGGNATAAATVTCPGGDVANPGCLHAVGSRMGFITVYPNGTAGIGETRTWNAGGGLRSWECVSGKACNEGVDDIAYVDAVIADLAGWAPVDSRRVYATGLSNGAAMSHRLACERAGVFAAIAAVGGTNQFSTVAECVPSRPVPVMQVHGTEDPCWTWETTDEGCLLTSGMKLGVGESTDAWVGRDGCTLGPATDPPIDAQDDGTSVKVIRWYGCENEVEVVLAEITGGGHTWPSGDPYLPERRVGRVSTEIDSDLIWAFLSRFALP